MIRENIFKLFAVLKNEDHMYTTFLQILRILIYPYRLKNGSILLNKLYLVSYSTYRHNLKLQFVIKIGEKEVNLPLHNDLRQIHSHGVNKLRK